MRHRTWYDDYTLQHGNPNSKEYKRALGRLELDKMEAMNGNRGDFTLFDFLPERLAALIYLIVAIALLGGIAFFIVFMLIQIFF